MRHKNILRNNSLAFSKTNKTLSHSFKIAMNFKKSKHKESQTCNQKESKEKEASQKKWKKNKGKEIYIQIKRRQWVTSSKQWIK